MEEKILKPGVQKMMFLEHILPQTHTACHHGLFLRGWLDVEQLGAGLNSIQGGLKYKDVNYRH